MLTTEKVLSRRIFTSLKEDHIVRLLKCEGMSIGSHAIIWELWEAESSSFGEKLLLGRPNHDDLETYRILCDYCFV